MCSLFLLRSTSMIPTLRFKPILLFTRCTRSMVVIQTTSLMWCGGWRLRDRRGTRACAVCEDEFSSAYVLGFRQDCPFRGLVSARRGQLVRCGSPCHRPLATSPVSLIQYRHNGCDAAWDGCELPSPASPSSMTTRWRTMGSSQWGWRVRLRGVTVVWALPRCGCGGCGDDGGATKPTPGRCCWIHGA